MKLAPGTYAEDLDRRELATFAVAIYGPATIMGLVTLRGAIKSRLRDLTIVGSAEFGDGNLSLPMGSVDAARIDLTIPDPFDGMRLSHCDARFREMRIQTHHFAEAAFVAGNGGSLDVERVEIDAYPQPQDALKYTTCFNLAAGTTATIRNSVLRECLGAGGRGAIVSSESGAIDVSFSTSTTHFSRAATGT